MGTSKSDGIIRVEVEVSGEGSVYVESINGLPDSVGLITDGSTDNFELALS